MIKLKRIYDEFQKSDGFRILVDRLWPRGVSKEKAHLDLWLKEVAPSTELRKWFGHDPEKWQEFIKRYKKELAANDAFGELKSIAEKEKNITLLYAARDEEHNEAMVLKELIS
jgi:uncharacterized protein YeaO (DUF488 family)